MVITPEKINEIVAAFLAEDKRLAEPQPFEIGEQVQGHPFIVCTNCAKFVKDKFFPDAKIVGYQTEENPNAQLGVNEGGHDFLLIDHRYIIDLWPKYILGEKSMPIMLDLTEDMEIIGRLYGSILKWEEVK